MLSLPIRNKRFGSVHGGLALAFTRAKAESVSFAVDSAVMALSSTLPVQYPVCGC